MKCVRGYFRLDSAIFIYVLNSKSLFHIFVKKFQEQQYLINLKTLDFYDFKAWDMREKWFQVIAEATVRIELEKFELLVDIQAPFDLISWISSDIRQPFLMTVKSWQC